MSDLQTLSQRVLQRFSAWSGYARFQEMLERFPDLEAYLAGGTIRNLLLDPQARIKDYDVLVNGPNFRPATDWLALEGRTTRGVYGNIHWYPQGDPMRADLIPVTNFNRVFVSRSVLDALNQFDFTGNAIALDLRSGALLNPQHGIEDMQRRIMRAIRYDHADVPIRAGHPLSYNACHWFRYLHYAAALGLEIEPVTMQWLVEHRHYRQLADSYAKEFKPLHPNALLVDEDTADMRMAT